MADLTEFGLADQLAAGKVSPGGAQTGGTTDPENELQIAQTARAFLAVGLQAVRRVLIARVALAHLEKLFGEEKRRVKLVLEPLSQLIECLTFAGEQASLDETGLHGDIAARFVQAVVNASDAVADLKA